MVAEELKEADCLLVATLDDICWLLNLRGNDIEYNPVFFSYLVFWPKDLKATLYIESEKVKGVNEYLESIQVTTKPYNQIFEDLRMHVESDMKIGFDKSDTNASLHKIVKESMVEVTDLLTCSLEFRKG